MGFFSFITGSFKKSDQLRKLQLEISPPGHTSTIEDLSDYVRKQLANGGNRREQTIEEFLDLCEREKRVKEIMNQYNLSREDLRQIYHACLSLGWIKGHYAPLSTIAYYEPLLYFVESKRQKIDHLTISFNLLSYWEGKIHQGGLLSLLKENE